MSIEEICKQYDIENYTINPDGSIDVDGGVKLNDKDLKKLPLTFNKVFGYFTCSHNKLTSLEGAPKIVSGSFSCSFNQLTSLEGGPLEVGGSFICSNNLLENLEYSPQVMGDFNCNQNKLTTLKKKNNNMLRKKLKNKISVII